MKEIIVQLFGPIILFILLYGWLSRRNIKKLTSKEWNDFLDLKKGAKWPKIR
tara:strand:+ start:662 stop:817 length:156 start_codon:yes stop_codon:yes gene_type:complete